MFFRLLMESFRRQRRRNLLAGIAILLGTTAVTAMLALATTIGDRIHKELAVYGANIVIYPKADLLDVKIGGVDVKPASGGAYLKESDLPIFCAPNNSITSLKKLRADDIIFRFARVTETDDENTIFLVTRNYVEGLHKGWDFSHRDPFKGAFVIFRKGGDGSFYRQNSTDPKIIGKLPPREPPFLEP